VLAAGCGGEPGKRGFREPTEGCGTPRPVIPGPPSRKKGSSPWAGRTTPNGVNFNLIKAPPNPPKPVQGCSGAADNAAASAAKPKSGRAGTRCPWPFGIDPTAEVANVKGGEALCPGGKENRSR
jgi:hypothetical protein